MLEKWHELRRKIDQQNNWVSAAGHGAICAVFLTVGLALEFLSYLVEPENPIAFITFFAGVGVGAYTLREGDEVDDAIGEPDEGRKLGASFEDWIAPVVVCVGLGAFYAGLF